MARKRQLKCTLQLDVMQEDDDHASHPEVTIRSKEHIQRKRKLMTMPTIQSHPTHLLLRSGYYEQAEHLKKNWNISHNYRNSSQTEEKPKHRLELKKHLKIRRS